MGAGMGVKEKCLGDRQRGRGEIEIGALEQRRERESLMEERENGGQS
jgi:hypothetical protein